MVKSRQLVQEYRKQIGRFTYDDMDCITSIENIITRYGGRSSAVGSNWWARHEIKNLRPLTQREQLYDGCAVLKTVLPGQPGYALPNRYKDDAVQIDYNHIGLGTDSGEILDSTRTADGRDGPGVSTAPIGPNSWDVIGDFEDVDYSDRFDSPTPATNGGDSSLASEFGPMLVTAQTGNTVNLRPFKRMDGIVLAYVPVGEIVTAFYAEGEWVRVEYAGKQGWMLGKFLSPVGSAQTPDSPTTPGTPVETPSSLTELLDEADRLVDRLAGLIFQIRGSA